MEYGFKGYGSIAHTGSCLTLWSTEARRTGALNPVITNNAGASIAKTFHLDIVLIAIPAGICMTEHQGVLVNLTVWSDKFVGTITSSHIHLRNTFSS